MKIIWHNHHIIPRWAGGSDDPSNIIKVNPAMHKFLHLQRYRELGDKRDLSTANLLNSFLKISYEDLSKRNSKSVKKAWTNPEYRKKMTKINSLTAKKQWEDPEMRKNTMAQAKVKCDHCDKVGQKRVMMRYHFDRCKFKNT